MINKLVITLLTSVMLVACANENKKRPVFYDSETDVEADTTYEADNGSQVDEDNIISIPFEERNGVKYVNVSVNGFGFEMIFDTGCSGTLISVAEANYLYEKGFLTQEDVKGSRSSQIADGSIVENMVVNLKEVVIDGKIRCIDVEATVSSNNNAPLLLGNEVLNRVAAYAVDNENKVINFKLK